MTDDVTYANASARQIDGIVAWHEDARRACAAARDAGAAEGLDVPFSTSLVHRAWRATSQLILAALDVQADAARRERSAALAAASRAETAARAAAAAGRDGEAAAHREAAAAARASAAQMAGWGLAARDARGTGAAVLAAEEPVAKVMYDAIAAAGGVAEVPRDKRYLSRAGAAV